MEGRVAEFVEGSGVQAEVEAFDAAGEDGCAAAGAAGRREVCVGGEVAAGAFFGCADGVGCAAVGAGVAVSAHSNTAASSAGVEVGWRKVEILHPKRGLTRNAKDIFCLQ